MECDGGVDPALRRLKWNRDVPCCINSNHDPRKRKRINKVEKIGDSQSEVA
jgi:hypothetical protein